MEIRKISEDILREANKILYDIGLLQVMGEFGDVFVTGSYYLNLMTWRDLDVYIRNDNMDKQKFFELGGKIASILSPYKMNYSDETILKRGKPDGLYWGVYASLFKVHTWKFDIFVLNSQDFEKLSNEAKELKQEISQQMEEPILKIKQSICNNPLYRKEVFSMDIYKAVMKGNVSSVDDFTKWLMEKKNISL